FEPISETADMLRDQLKINDIDSFVTIKNMGVGDKEGTLSFTNGKGAMNRVSLIDEVEDITSVKVTTLDAELSENAKYFLKIDVEGYEYNVIEGASELLTKDNVSAIIIESNGSGSKYGYTDMDVHKMLLGYGFIAILYDPFTRKVAQVDDDKIPSIGNTIYIKDIFVIAERCRVAPVCMVHTAGGLKI
ncbi:MAG: FkbM family methyltransferase, partial [SAR86 cluster bacterium]|nr:FkbM family methyltransferase [SAR86 cluster bacterium]